MKFIVLFKVFLISIILFIIGIVSVLTSVENWVGISILILSGIGILIGTTIYNYSYREGIISCTYCKKEFIPKKVTDFEDTFCSTECYLDYTGHSSHSSQI